MPYYMTIEATSGIDATEVTPEVASACQEAYQALSQLPVNRQCVLVFDESDDPAENAKDARNFVRMGKTWAAAQQVEVNITDDEGKVTGTQLVPLVFARKGDVKADPARVSFRIYIPKRRS